MYIHCPLLLPPLSPSLSFSLTLSLSFLSSIPSSPLHLFLHSTAGYFTTTTLGVSPTPDSSNLFTIVIIVVAVSLFLMIAFVIGIICGCCVCRWKNRKNEEGTWTPPSYRNGKKCKPGSIMYLVLNFQFNVILGKIL